MDLETPRNSRPAEPPVPAPDPARPAPHPDPAAPRTTVFGVLGGIASGKSRVARLLAGPLGVVLDADRLAREVLESREIAERLAQRFGPAVLDAEGRPDREKLAEIVFAGEGGAEARAELESWIHPEVRRRLREGLERAREAGVERVVLDVPLLVENEEQHGLGRWCDVLVFVDSFPRDREERAMASRGWRPGEVRRREALQVPLSEKRALAHHVIENRGTADDLARSVQHLLSDLGFA